jgi:hypothetical protein
MNRRIADTLPELSAEIALLLQKEGRPDLARQLADLTIHDRCRCGDDFCGTFYTVPRPNGPWGPGLECIALEPDQGMLILDVVGGTISSVEVLYRDEVRAKLLEMLP